MQLPKTLYHKVFVVSWEVFEFPESLEPYREEEQEEFMNRLQKEKFKVIWLLNKFKDPYFVKGADPMHNWRITPRANTTLKQIEEFCRQSQLLSYVKKV